MVIGTLPIRPGLGNNSYESYKDVMLIQMSLYPMVQEDSNEQEVVLKEGYLKKRVCLLRIDPWTRMVWMNCGILDTISSPTTACVTSITTREP